jgi:hypothetical protein
MDTIATILNLTQDENGKYPFKIVNEYESLRLVHYDQNTIHNTEVDNELRKIRGVIVDIEEKKVVCPSFGYTPSIVSNSLPEPESVVKDSYDKEYTFPKEFKIFPVTEGTMIRVWKYKGQLMFSSHKRINCDKSRWGTSGFFKDLFMKYIGDFNLNDMVNEGKIANFILMDKDLTIATKFPMGKRDGLIVFLGFTDENNTTISYETTLPSLKEHSIDDTNTNTNLFSSWELNMEDANKHLTQGFYDYPAKEQSDILCLGEGLVITYNKNGNNAVMIVNSEAYTRRIKLVDNDPNILHRCYKLISKTYYPKVVNETDTYLNSFPAVPVMSVEEINELETPFVTEMKGKNYTEDELTNKLNKNSYELRLRNALTWYAMSLSLSHQLSAFQNINNLINERKQICDIMCTKYESFIKGDFDGYETKYYPDVFKYIQHRIVNARDFAKTNNKGKTTPSMILNNIKTGVMRDSGDWLYNIAKVLIRIPAKTNHEEYTDSVCVAPQNVRFNN